VNFCIDIYAYPAVGFGTALSKIHIGYALRLKPDSFYKKTSASNAHPATRDLMLERILTSKKQKVGQFAHPKG